MGYAILNPVTDLIFGVFGSGSIMVVFILLFFVVIMFIMRVNVGTMLVVLLPLMLGLFLTPAVNNFIDLQPWVFYITLLVLGIFLGFLFLNIMKN